jgi:hypothetical protein
MDIMGLEQLVRNIDRRLDRVEQFLPTLATREELRAAIAPLATREELHTAIAPLATREEMHAAIKAAVVPLATKEELAEAFQRSRSESRALYEDLKDDIRLLGDGIVNVQQTLERMVHPRLENHEQRITALELGTRPAPARRPR